ncbi:hypothetical protein FOA43_002889 [Brettanomyces nanus]|uniref:Xenotropic and polytropic retrovirus receptor 1 n=1 Tax=Eeniella nana TaxID=13502 RepID=A0A875S8X6_EENNA|nr:uncharacterized protein FOA43_002889 [Brettanomyces nanus]QPG75534.1 hypothetical protein FOA43_002889 [Brettanomyces nanus]
MKFAQSLEQHIVPEWRGQYLDYKNGKKKIKKLQKRTSVLQVAKDQIDQSGTSSHHLPTPKFSFRSPRSKTTVSGSPQPIYSSTEPVINTPEQRGISEHRVTFPNASAEPFSLPSPAIYPETLNQSSISTRDSLSTDSETGEGTNVDTSVNINARTPLLSKQSAPIGELNHRKSSVFKLLDTLRRQNSLTQLSQLLSHSSENANMSLTELEEMSLYAKQQFINWVDSELRKVDEFFREREQDSLERFLVLQDQLIQLNEKKEQAKIQMDRILEGTTISRQRQRAVSDVSDDYDVCMDDEEEDENDENTAASDVQAIAVSEPSMRSKSLATANSKMRIFIYWAQNELGLFTKFDLPSLPTFDWLKENGKAEKQYYEEGYYDSDDSDDTDNNSLVNDPRYNRKDYMRKKKRVDKVHNVSYFAARRQLKRAVYEFYHSLELLKSFRLMNRTAFRKLIKKYDKTTDDTLLPTYMKTVDSKYFTTSDVLDNLMVKAEEMFTQYFENGNRKIALTKLREIQAEKTYYAPNYLNGWLLGMALPIFAFTVFYALDRTIGGDLPEGKWLMQIWAGFFLLCLMAMLFGINCFVWDEFKVNYKLIFEFNPRDNLNFRQYLVLPTLLFFIGSLLAWFSFEDFWPVEFNGRDWPWIFLIISIAILFCPFDILYLNARTWFLSTVFRLVLSGLYPVEFRDFFLGDIFCSLTYSISNTSMFLCLYRTHWDKCLDGSGLTKCGSSGSRLLGFLSALPNIWRFLQCFRRFADTGDGFPHLANMCKYLISCMYYMSLSMYRIDTIPQNRSLLIVFGGINGLVSAAWDLLMDWSLFQFHSKNFLLRDEITYKRKWVYYSAMITDVILRHQWVCYALFQKHIQQSAVTGFGVALAEVIRRFIWIFFRMENEHATNVHLFRASRDAPLPFPTSRKRRRRAVKSRVMQQFHVSDEEAQYASTATGITTGFVPAPQPAHTAEGLRTRGQEPSLAPLSEEGSTRNTEATTNYWGTLSKVLKMAHIKDFQRRKPRSVSDIAAEEARAAAGGTSHDPDGDDSDNGGADTDEDIAEDEYRR